ncbi:hypothetical protein EK904_008535 [Melospiza melodia maxima]|nr:hypothetical protein EK904_008535 [Melospiza melodia maxima]
MSLFQQWGEKPIKFIFFSTFALIKEGQMFPFTDIYSFQRRINWLQQSRQNHRFRRQQAPFTGTSTLEFIPAGCVSALRGLFPLVCSSSK